MTRKQPKCPLTEEWIKKMWYVYTMEYYPDIKKNEIMSFAATWMDLEVIMLNEVNQTEKDKHHIISLISGIFKKYTNELICRTETDLQTLKTYFGYQTKEDWGLGLAHAHRSI